jgi:hypothetical protein
MKVLLAIVANHMVQIAVVQRQGDGLHGVLNPTTGELALLASCD